MLQGIVESRDQLVVRNHRQKNFIEGKRRVIGADFRTLSGTRPFNVYRVLSWTGGKGMSIKHRSELQKHRTGTGLGGTLGDTEDFQALLRNVCPRELIPSQEELNL